MINLGRQWTTDTIDNWVTENPPRTYPPERSLNKMVSAFLSQSFPPPTLDELPFCNFKLADFSNGDVQRVISGIPCLIFTFSTVCI
jgi:serine/threonine-protein kinase SRPK3